MANEDIVGSLSLGGWSKSCVNLLPNLSTIAEGFVNQYGQPIGGFGDEAWGISKGLCDQYCNEDAIPVVGSSCRETTAIHNALVL